MTANIAPRGNVGGAGPHVTSSGDRITCPLWAIVSVSQGRNEARTAISKRLRMAPPSSWLLTPRVAAFVRPRPCLRRAHRSHEATQRPEGAWTHGCAAGTRARRGHGSDGVRHETTG